VISTAYVGARRRVVQGFVTEPIERVPPRCPAPITSIPPPRGNSTVTVWLKLNEDSTAALAELSSRLSQIRYELPAAPRTGGHGAARRPLGRCSTST